MCSNKLRGHNWVHFVHRPQCTVTLNSNFAILKTSSNSNPVSQSHTGLHDRPLKSSTHKLAKLSSLFSAFKKCLQLQKLVPQCFMLPIEHYW